MDPNDQNPMGQDDQGQPDAGDDQGQAPATPADDNNGTQDEGKIAPPPPAAEPSPEPPVEEPATGEEPAADQAA